MSNQNPKNDLQGFKVLLVKFSDKSQHSHQVFMKEHSVKTYSEDTPIGRTLYLINIPPWATENSILKSFEQSSIKIKTVTFVKPKDDPPKTSFKTAYAVFNSPETLAKALKLKSLPALSKQESVIETGMLKWINKYNHNISFQAERKMIANQVIQKYDAEEEEQKKKEKNGLTDDEGWTVVAKKGRKAGIARKESVMDKLKAKNMKKETVLKNFYRHQIRQEKKDQLAALRKKAEEDKKKILLLKQKRAFKPF